MTCRGVTFGVPRPTTTAVSATPHFGLGGPAAVRPTTAGACATATTANFGFNPANTQKSLKDTIDECASQLQSFSSIAKVQLIDKLGDMPVDKIIEFMAMVSLLSEKTSVR